MRHLFIYVYIFSITGLFAQTQEELFSKANDFYKNGNFQNAIETYLQIEKKGLQSSELYYNIGNAYYKLNKVGPSIYYFEKALLINPLNEDAQNNLVFAQRLALDNIESIPQNVFQRLNQKYLQVLTYNQWAIVMVVFAFLTSILFLLFYFTYKPNTKRFYFLSSSICFILFVMVGFITYNQYQNYQNFKPAIVFDTQIDVRDAPTNNSEEIFILHEGAKVFVLDAIDSWKKIKLADGKQGWLQASAIKELKK